METGEGGDRGDLNWNQEYHDHMAKFTNLGKVIGFMAPTGPIRMTNLANDCHALLLNIVAGQMYAPAMADIIFGRANPSGKLSFTAAVDWAQWKWSPHEFPGDDNGEKSFYIEKHHFGYRYMDQNKLTPQFPFGHGISYTTFEYSDLKIEGQKVTMTLKNTGKVAGSEVVQVYLGVPWTWNFRGGYRSPKALKQFVKVKDLAPGASKTVEMDLDDRAFSYWDTSKAQWVKDKGWLFDSHYKVYVGSSSRDIRLEGKIKL